MTNCDVLYIYCICACTEYIDSVKNYYIDSVY